MNNPSVSVIVPAYNVEPFLVQCLESLIRQSLGSMEIIIVDDGSTDGTPNIIKSFADRHQSIRVITQENQGLSVARNAGMDAARGEFIGFVDADDWVDDNMFETLSAVAIKSQVDIVICNGRLVDHETGESRPIQDRHVWKTLKARHADLVLSPRTEPDLFMLDSSVCKRLFRREFLESVDFRFPAGKIFEDVPTHFYLLLNTENVALSDRAFYFYRTNHPGRITARTDKTLLQVFDVMQQVMDDLHSHNADLVIWANYIWFQNWVLRWLRNQITQAFADEFDRRCYQISKKFKEGSLEVFREKFSNNQPARNFVAKQVANRLGNVEMSKNKKPGKPVNIDTFHLGNDPEGIFNKDPHTFMPDIWGWLCMNFGIQSVLDIGCGMGTNLSWFNEYGFDVLGVEGHPNAVAASLIPGKIIQHDFTRGPWSPKREFDLCVCTEFAEHVESEFEENWMVAVDECKYLLLAAAPPGQGGYHHVNEQPEEYWVKRFKSREYIHIPEITNKLRATCARKPAPWGRNTLLFFARKDLANILPNSNNNHSIYKRNLPPVEIKLRRELKKLRLKNMVLTKQLKDIHASGSWRVIAPLRWILGRIKREQT